jgi:triosephosphate isomerase
MHQFIVAANWKMYLSTDEEISFFLQHKDELVELAAQENSQIILFPSFISLQILGGHITPTALKMGAQDCSNEEEGAFTGQVSARSLAQVGCSYTLVAHSERRAFNESDTVLVQKVAQLFNNNITPIICIGETQEEYEKKETEVSLTQQLTPYLELIRQFQKPFCIAYEPVWAIGTGTTPTPQEITSVFELIDTTLATADENNAHSLLYGGSVTSELAPTLQGIPKIGGFLVGGASIDFQEFKKIVLSKKI